MHYKKRTIRCFFFVRHVDGATEQVLDGKLSLTHSDIAGYSFAKPQTNKQTLAASDDLNSF